MSNEHIGFDEVHILHQLKHYLPTQAPLKDFIHHNTLHAFQNQRFDLAIRNASKIFGYKVSFSVDEFRDLYLQKKVAPEILEQIIERKKGKGEKQNWVDKVLHTTYDEVHPRKTGQLRKRWKEIYHLDLDTIVHTNLFRILNSYLDQGVAIHKFPVSHYSFLDSLRELEKNSFVSFFKTKRARGLFFDESLTIRDLLTILVGDEKYFSQYLFDQQFAHPGWSGLISAIEDKPLSLLDGRKISLSGLIRLELLLEIDNLDNSLKRKWKPIATDLDIPPVELFSKNELTELDEVLNIWQEAYEWTYFDQVLAGIQEQQATTALQATPSFMAFFCIDDRVGSIRRHIEHLDPKCETYGTPGHFGVDAFYQPKNARFYTKICPAPLSPRHLIKEVTTNRENRSEVHFTKTTHSLFRGWLITQTLGFWSAIKLMFNVFKPSFGPASSSSFSHMDEFSTITVENRSPGHSLDGLQLGYTVDEMTDRVEAVLKSTGAISGFSSLVYVIGHGSSSANNTHYAGYDCGACSGRPGSANARAFSYMANHKEVRIKLAQRGIHIPLETEFIGGLHDTSRDEFGFYDEELLSPTNLKLHYGHLKVFKNALQLNAKERSRRFMSIDTNLEAWEIHDQVKKRSVSLFEPRPELNHA
ncbi:MAG: DUF2309 domain-containing protein, partial [Cyclobacteriaceae bacterium]|nr:DUF2309 domain-containing protein [Cyclobacteriaceae bacterium]